MTNDSKFKKYLKIYLCAVIVYFTLCAASVWLVDPYNELGRNKIGLYYFIYRKTKESILRVPHNAVLIGSSKTLYIKPKDLNCFDFYNASVIQSFPEEYYFYFKKYLRDEKLIIIGLDFYMFNERQFPTGTGQEWKERRFGALEYLTSFNAFKDSLRSVYKRFVLNQQPPKINEQGGTGYFNRNKQIFVNFTLDNEDQLTPTLIAEQHQKALDLLHYHYLRRYQLSQPRLEYLKKIKALAKEKNIKLLVFINPYHKEVLKLIDDMGLTSQFVSWKAYVKEIFPDAKDFSNDNYSTDDSFPQNDHSHYYPEVGAQMINQQLQDNHLCEQ
jgi:hypothetical protein